MKFTLGWLKEYLDTDAGLDEISKTLTDIGLEVEGIENPGESLAAFVVAKIEAVDKHPDADRLKICRVNIGDGGDLIQVVCGAPNAKAGLVGVFAAPGSYIPGLDTTLKVGKIRGIESKGMMLSEREMQLSDEHEGIVELATNAPIGTSYPEYAGLTDPVIEICLTPNRADCAGIYGIARDLAAAGIGTLKPLEAPSPTFVSPSFPCPVSVSLDFEDMRDSTEPVPCPVFLGRVIKGVQNGPSPKWMQDRLSAVGLRPISALVDITNYMTLAYARPLHVFDLGKLNGNIKVRLSKGDESIDALNDKSYELKDEIITICDESGVIGLGGIVGGTSTAVDENTTDIFLEIAAFDPMRIARTGRDLSITSDARYRFERGIDLNFMKDHAANIATQMILDLCNPDDVAEISELTQAGEYPAGRAPIQYNPSKCEKLTGVSVELSRQCDILERLGFAIDQTEGQSWSVTPPSWRSDIFGQADLVEEIIRIVGYDQIPIVPVVRKNSLPLHSSETRGTALSRLFRSALAVRGFQEAVTWSFMSSKRAKLFVQNTGPNTGQNTDKAANENIASLRLNNPISADLDQMRPTPVGNLIEAAARNADRGIPNARLFEIGPAFETARPDGQILVTAGIRCGTAPRHWIDGDGGRKVDAFDAKADLMALLKTAGFDADKAPISRDAPGYYHPGQSGTLRLGRNILGHFGMAHPAILAEMGIDFPVAVFELYPNNIPAPRQKGTARAKLTLPDLQPVRRDFAFIVGRGVEAEQIIRLAKGSDKKLIADVAVFDVYTGKGIEEDEKSVAIEMTLQPRDKTLTDEDIEAVSKKLVDAVCQKTGGRLRR